MKLLSFRVADDDHTYERQAIIQWIEKNVRSPLTNQQLSLERLYPNDAIKKVIDHFEKSMKSKTDQYTLNVDVRKKAGRPLFQTFGKTIYYADWLPTNENRSEVILLKIDGARAKRESTFYVDLSRHPHLLEHTVLSMMITDEESNTCTEHASLASLYEFLQARRKPPEETIIVQMFLQIIDAMIFLSYNVLFMGI